MPEEVGSVAFRHPGDGDVQARCPAAAACPRKISQLGSKPDVDTDKHRGGRVAR